MAVSDDSIAGWASRLSCDGMSDMAKEEYHRNLNQHLYVLSEPPCDMAFGFADRRQESLLQNGAAISRNVCIEKLPAYQRGPWEAAFAPLTPQQPKYDQWTRARLHSKCDMRSKNDCDCRLQRERFI